MRPALSSPWFIDENGFSSVFYDILLDGAMGAHFQPEWLIAMMCSESGLNPRAFNKNGGASGLSQLMPSVLRKLGWAAGEPDYEASGGAFHALSADKQIVWTLRYFEDWQRRYRIRQWENRAHMYLCNFLPALLPGGTHYDRVLVRRGGECALSPIMGQAHIDLIYDQNRGLDRDGKGFITPGDLEESIAHSVRCVRSKYDAAIASLAKAKGARETTDPELDAILPGGHEDDELQASVPDDPICKPS